MPLFEYRCEACAHLEEVLQKHTDPAPESCPACGKAGTMAKAISLTSFQLKGGGWYKDLYASSSSAKTDSADASGGGSAGTSTSSATPAASPAPSAAPAKAQETKAAAPASSTAASSTASTASS